MKKKSDPFLYKKRGRYANSVDMSRCRASVSGGPAEIHQCGRPGSKSYTMSSGDVVLFCGTHHPDNVAARERRMAERYSRQNEVRSAAWDMRSLEEAITVGLDKVLTADPSLARRLPRSLLARVESWRKLVSKWKP